jgi:UrcA family protein
MKTPAIIFVSAIALAALPGRASAGELEFRYAAGELSSAAGIAALYDRLGDRAADACDIYQNSGLLRLEYRDACAAELTDEIVAKIGDGALVALHERRHAERLATGR